LRQSPGEATGRPGEEQIIGRSLAMTQMLRQARRIARTEAPVLIRGESGSGKELIAQLLHRSSARASGPFVAVNCAAIQPTLIQSELFGHERGAFTGAVSDKVGLFETSHRGTVFLDEIGDLPLDLQANLLRFLQEGTISRVGSTRSIKLDVRVLAATHVDLEKGRRRGHLPPRPLLPPQRPAVARGAAARAARGHRGAGPPLLRQVQQRERTRA
jgi:DNA-binding NtrC family response regulator